MTTHSQRALILYRRRRFINHLLTYLLTYKVKAPNSELVIVQLLKSYCLPFLLYASEAVSPSHSIVHWLLKFFMLLAVAVFRLYAILFAYFMCET